MRGIFFLLLVAISFQAKSQNAYNCFDQSDLPANWTFLGPYNPSHQLANQRFGLVYCMSINKENEQEIFAGAPTSGLFHTTDRGAHWTCLTDNSDLPIVGVKDLIVDYSKKPYTILIATGEDGSRFNSANLGIFKSVDGGKTWKRKLFIDNLIFTQPINEFIQAGSNLIARGHNEFYISKDQGETWSILLSENTKLYVSELKERSIWRAFYEEEKNELYFSTIQKGISTGLVEQAQLYRLSLEDNKLERITHLLEASYNNPSNKLGIICIQILRGDEGELIFANNYAESQEMVLHTYNIKQGKITNYQVPSNSLRDEDLKWFAGFQKHKKNSKIIYLCGRTLLKSENNGESFTNLYPYGFGDNNVPHADLRCIYFMSYSEDGKSDRFYIGTDGGISYSENGGKSFVNLNGPELPITQFHGLGASPFSGIISAGAQDNSIFSYLPKEKKWIHEVRGDGYDVVYSKTIPGVGFGQYNARLLLKTENDIAPFTLNPRFGFSENSNIRQTLKTDRAGHLYFVDMNLNVLKKDAEKWEKHPMTLSHRAQCFDVSETNPAIIYAGGEWRDLIKSTDGGKTWENLNKNLLVDGMDFSGAKVNSICISPYDEDRVWIGLGYPGDYRQICKETHRVLSSLDGGKTWRNESQGLPVFAIQDIQFYRGTYEGLFAACDQGVYYKKGSGYSWQRFSNNLPKSIITEMEINYCRGKLMAATFGRGLWETDLPPIEFKNPEIIKNEKTITAPKGEAVYMDRDLILRKKAVLVIDCPVHMPKGSRIEVRNKKQVILTEKGKLLNDCGENWQGIIVK